MTKRRTTPAQALTVPKWAVEAIVRDLLEPPKTPCHRLCLRCASEGLDPKTHKPLKATP